ncbi:hypothetical protein QEJ31_08550 [Pigmentibacter sp. JX0631]|uniref:hypothetical protein n=1 Tax=Pigmentibacter sp. JX0631 TaxID=2976982 RepID=UPI0024687255|nr:hypothetical protein [Pigmentibacter sp. JX0631]WGL58584.1 hypothetical protein QEJ31_08550 [Pigmentibacter sp. JX0631]
MDLKTLSCLFLLIYLVIAVIDGFYFHIYKYKLYAREDSKKEHFLHTLNAILFPWSIFFVFCDKFKGLFLYFGIFLLILSLIIEFFDLYEELKSRKSLGGLTSNEYAMHFSLSALRATYSTLILVSRPTSDWIISNSHINYNYNESLLVTYFIYPVITVGIFTAIFHVILFFIKTDNVKEIENL